MLLELSTALRIEPKLRFKEFNESWEENLLESIGTFSRGKSKHRPRNDRRLFGNSYPFIQTGDVKKANLFLNEYSTMYSEFGLAQSKLWHKGTLCITIAANIAETAILNIDACFPDSVIGFESNKTLSNELFVKYLFDNYKEKSRGYQKELLKTILILRK